MVLPEPAWHSKASKAKPLEESWSKVVLPTQPKDAGVECNPESVPDSLESDSLPCTAMDHSHRVSWIDFSTPQWDLGMKSS